MKNRYRISTLLSLSLWLSALSLIPIEVAQAESRALEIAALSGNWYEVGVECNYCENFDQQKLIKADDAALLRFSDRLELTANLQSGKLVARTQGSQTSTSSVELIPSTRRNLLYVVQFANGDGARASDLYARVWVLEPLGNNKLLYGRRYQVSAFSDDAFEAKGKGFKAREKYLSIERVLANLEDVRVFSLNQARTMYQPGNQVRFTYEGVAAFVREGLTEQDQLVARDRARAAAQDRASREALFRTLIRQGDEAYGQEKYDEALNRYKAGSAIMPEMALVHTDLGAVYQIQNKLPEAEGAYRLSLELEPSDQDTRFNLGMVLEQSGRLSEALEQYRIVLDHRPADTETRDRIAKLSQKLGAR